MNMMDRSDANFKLDWCVGEEVIILTDMYSDWNTYRMAVIEYIFIRFRYSGDRDILINHLEVLIEALTPIDIKRKNKWNKI